MNAADIIAAKGQSVTLTYHSAGDYDTSSGTVTAADSSVATVGVVLPLSRGLKHMPGTNISVGDQQLLLPGDIDEPAVDTTATIDGKDFTIIEVAPLAPAGEALIYDCVIRGVA